MIYIIRNTDNTIKTFSNNLDYVLMDGETRETLETTMSNYADRFQLSVNKSTIQADDADQAIVTLQSNTGLSSIDVDVNGVVETVTLTNGEGTLPAITAAVAGTITITPADLTEYPAAGGGSLTIIAEEV